jgi:Uma2 family endonuclease
MMSKEIPIACNLNDRELQERRKNILDKIAASLIDSEELSDGFRYRFPIDDAILQNLITVINLERKCCPFLSFKLNLEAGKNFASLDLTGEQGAKEAIKELFDWNWFMGLAKLKVETVNTPEDYLNFEREADTRHEFLDGEIYQMAGESLPHSRICMNLAREVGNSLKGKRCEPLSPNMKVRTSSASLFAYPDLTIVCGEPIFHDRKKDVLTNPQVIFEVLSPSTAEYDRTTKFQRYRMGNETLTDYILVSQDKPFVEHFFKQADGNWLYQSYGAIDDILKIETVECQLSLREIYDRVELTFETEEFEED